jgi:hypothetical protein
MALTIKFNANRSVDFTSIEISDAGTLWLQNGEMSKADVIGITLYLYGENKDVPLREVVFTEAEKTNFLSGWSVTILFEDDRLFAPAKYAPDDFYVCTLNVTGGDIVNTQVAFDSYFYIKQVVMEHLTKFSLPLNSFHEANRQITGDLASITQLDYLSSILSIPRENKWRKVYNFLLWNHGV